MRPVGMDRDNLSHFLRQCADQIDKGACPSGQIVWSGIIDNPIQYNVKAAVRVAATGSDEVGGGWVVGEPDPTLQEVTESRRRDLAHRMKMDYTRANPMLGEEAIDEMVDQSMFFVEQLLAEIEGLRS